MDKIVASIVLILSIIFPPSAQPKVYYPIAGFDNRIKLRSFGQYITPADQKTVPCGAPFVGYHTGDDLEVTESESNSDVPVFSILDGQVISVGNVSGYGGLIVIKYPEFTAYYGHVANFLVKAGDKVTAGQKLAVLGLACSTQTDGERKHLHFALHKGLDIDVRGYVNSQTELNNWLDPKVELQNLRAQ